MQSKSSRDGPSSGKQATRMTHGQAIALIMAITVGVCIYIIPLGLFGIKEFWCGILFLLYWSNFEHMDNKRFIPSLVGALVGLGMAYLFATLPALLGPAMGWGIALGVVVVAVYLLLMGWLSLFVNMATMLFLTVAGTPEMLGNADFPGAAIALVVGAAYFTAVTNLGMYVVSRLQGRETAAG